MKCNSFIPPNPEKKRGKKFAPISWWQTSDLGIFAGLSSTDLLASGHTVCQGTIKADVKIEYGPHRDDETLGASYSCDTCGQDFFMGLPTGDAELSAWVMRAIEAADFATHAAGVKEERRLADEQRAEMMARYEASKKKS